MGNDPQDTLPGSLGAPIFDSTWRFLGIRMGVVRRLKYGCWIDRVVTYLNKKGIVFVAPPSRPVQLFLFANVGLYVHR